MDTFKICVENYIAEHPDYSRGDLLRGFFAEYNGTFSEKYFQWWNDGQVFENVSQKRKMRLQRMKCHTAYRDYRIDILKVSKDFRRIKYKKYSGNWHENIDTIITRPINPYVLAAMRVIHADTRYTSR